MAELEKVTQDVDGQLFINGERIECYACFDRGYYVETIYWRSVVKDCECKKGETSGKGSSKADHLQQDFLQG